MVTMKMGKQFSSDESPQKEHGALGYLVLSIKNFLVFFTCLGISSFILSRVDMVETLRGISPLLFLVCLLLVYVVVFVLHVLAVLTFFIHLAYGLMFFVSLLTLTKPFTLTSEKDKKSGDSCVQGAGEPLKTHQREESAPE